MKDKIFGVLQRVGRSFMLPIAILPVAGLLLGLGSSFTNTTTIETLKVDTFTSATKQKTRSSLAKGSYHVNSDGSDITGVTFPVKVSDISVLKDKKQIKDNASVSITTAIKGKATTTEYK